VEVLRGLIAEVIEFFFAQGDERLSDGGEPSLPRGIVCASIDFGTDNLSILGAGKRGWYQYCYSINIGKAVEQQKRPVNTRKKGRRRNAEYLASALVCVDWFPGDASRLRGSWNVFGLWCGHLRLSVGGYRSVGRPGLWHY